MIGRLGTFPDDVDAEDQFSFEKLGGPDVAGPANTLSLYAPSADGPVWGVTDDAEWAAMLRADEADLAIGSMLDVPDDIIYRPSLFYSSTLITPQDHPLSKLKKITLEDIGQYGLILPPRHLATWRMLEMVFGQHGSKFNVSLEAGGWEIIKKYVGLDMGVSIVSSLCLTDDDNLFNYPLDDYMPKRSYGVVVRRGKFLSPQSQAFIDMIDQEFFSEYPALK